MLRLGIAAAAALVCASEDARSQLQGSDPATKPVDNPCVTWVQGSCSVSGLDPGKFIPAIYSAWMWRPSGTCGAPGFGGSCQQCSGRPGDFSCGYLFPCFSVSAGVWGHKDVCASEGPCIAHLPARPKPNLVLFYNGAHS